MVIHYFGPFISFKSMFFSSYPYWAQYYIPMLDNVRRSGPFRKSNLVQFKINAA